MKKTKQISIYIFVFFVIWVCRVFLFNYFDAQLETKLEKSLSTNLFRLFIWVVPVFVFLVCDSKTNPLEYLKLKAINIGILRWGTGVLCLVFLYQMMLYYLGLDDFNIGKDFLDYFNSIIIPPIFEEILFRGFIQQKLNELMSSIKAILITSILFVLIHLPGWLLLNSLDYSYVEITKMSVVIFVLSVLMGWLLKKSKSLYPSIALHSLNNFISAM